MRINQVKLSARSNMQAFVDACQQAVQQRAWARPATQAHQPQPWAASLHAQPLAEPPQADAGSWGAAIALPGQPPQQQQQGQAAAVVDPQVVAQLQVMGFSFNSALRAAMNTGNTGMSHGDPAVLRKMFLQCACLTFQAVGCGLVVSANLLLPRRIL